jgi:hypothetical protein
MEESERNLRPDAADGVDQQAEQLALRRRHEAIQHMRILADDQVREQPHLATGGGQLVERGQRNQHLVADAVDLHDHQGRQGLDQLAVEKRNHARPL